MIGPLSAPGMQDTGKAGQRRADEARGLGEAFERLGRGRAQGLVGEPGMGAAQGAQRFWARCRCSGSTPQAAVYRVGCATTARLADADMWTVSLATGMSDVMLLSTTCAGREALAVGAGAASADGVNRLVVRGRESGESARYTLGHRW